MGIIYPICMLLLSAYQMLERIGVCGGSIGVYD
jgi:starch synthase